MTINKLKAGYKDFYQKYFIDGNQFDELKDSQSPVALVVSCSDSRVDPAILTNSAPGDIFVVRNVASIVPPFDDRNNGLHGVSSAIEFATKNLNVNKIIVIGHSRCAGVAHMMSLLDPKTVTNDTFVTNWVSSGIPYISNVEFTDDKDENICLSSQEVVKMSLKNLETFPWIKSAIEKKEFELLGWFFDIRDGNLLELDKNSGEFTPV